MQCGATLRQQANQESERQALRSQLGAVQSQLLQISQRLERLQARLAQLESDDETQPAVSPPAPASQLVAEQPAGDAPVRSEQLSDAAPAPSEPTGAVPPQPAAPEADEVRHGFTRPPDFERPTPRAMRPPRRRHADEGGGGCNQRRTILHAAASPGPVCIPAADRLGAGLGTELAGHHRGGDPGAGDRLLPQAVIGQQLDQRHRPRPPRLRCRAPDSWSPASLRGNACPDGRRR